MMQKEASKIKLLTSAIVSLWFIDCSTAVFGARGGAVG
jgi:hypothetical protein